MKHGIIISSETGVGESLRIVLRETAQLKFVAGDRDSIQWLHSRPVDFAILDSSLRDQDPVEVLTRLLSAVKSLPVIALVPSIHAPLVSALKQAGAYAVVEKPFDGEGILNLVELAVERKQLMSEVEHLRAQVPASSGETPSNESGTEVSYFYREVLRRFSRVLSRVFDRGRLYEMAVEAILDTFNAGKAVILVQDRKSGDYRPASFHGYPDEVAGSLVCKSVDPLSTRLVRDSRIICSHQLTGSDDFDLCREIELLDADIVTGLFARGRLIGILAIGKKTTGEGYSKDDLQLLAIISTYLAVAIENASLYRDNAAQRSYYEKVLSSLKTGVVTINSRGTITTFNRAAGDIMDLDPAEMIGSPVEKAGSQFADILRRTLAGDGVYRRHEIYSPVNKKPLGVSTSTMVDEEGKIEGAVMVFADLSRIKYLEEQARDIERVEFWAKTASRLAHEVKNPLVPIKTFAQLLPQRYADDEFREEFFQVVNREIDRLNDIVTRVMKFAELPRPCKKPTDINSVIERAFRLLGTKIKSKGVTVTRNFATDKISLPVDEELLSESFANIVDNALNAIGDKGSITVSTSIQPRSSHPENTLEVVFRDSGRGMSAEEIQDIFIPFVSLQTYGMGFGLPIAQRIIKDHDGWIEVESTPGKGTAMRVFLPLEQGS